MTVSLGRSSQPAPPPPVLKLERVAGNCLLDKRHAAESYPIDGSVRAEIWYSSCFCGSVGPSRDTSVELSEGPTVTVHLKKSLARKPLAHVDGVS